MCPTACLTLNEQCIFWKQKKYRVRLWRCSYQLLDKEDKLLRFIVHTDANYNWNFLVVFCRKFTTQWTRHCTNFTVWMLMRPILGILEKEVRFLAMVNCMTRLEMNILRCPCSSYILGRIWNFFVFQQKVTYWLKVPTVFFFCFISRRKNAFDAILTNRMTDTRYEKEFAYSRSFLHCL